MLVKKNTFTIQLFLDGETYHSAPLEGSAEEFADRFYNMVAEATCFKMTLENGAVFVIGKDATRRGHFIFKDK